MNLSASAARAKSDFVIPGINDEADPAGHCPIPRSSLRASPSGWQKEAPVTRHRQVRGFSTQACSPGRISTPARLGTSPSVARPGPLHAGVCPLSHSWLIQLRTTTLRPV